MVLKHIYSIQRWIPHQFKALFKYPYMTSRLLWVHPASTLGQYSLFTTQQQGNKGPHHCAFSVLSNDFQHPVETQSSYILQCLCPPFIFCHHSPTICSTGPNTPSPGPLMVFPLSYFLKWFNDWLLAPLMAPLNVLSSKRFPCLHCLKPQLYHYIPVISYPDLCFASSPSLLISPVHLAGHCPSASLT